MLKLSDSTLEDISIVILSVAKAFNSALKPSASDPNITRILSSGVNLLSGIASFEGRVAIL